MRVEAACEQCGSAPLGHTEASPYVAFVWLLCLHAAPPHAGHKLKVLIDGQEIPSMPIVGKSIEMKIRCLQCQGPEVERTATMPEALAGVLALAHHSRHEGHPFEFWVDGKKVV